MGILDQIAQGGTGNPVGFYMKGVQEKRAMKLEDLKMRLTEKQIEKMDAELGRPEKIRSALEGVEGDTPADLFKKQGITLMKAGLPDAAKSRMEMSDQLSKLNVADQKAAKAKLDDFDKFGSEKAMGVYSTFESGTPEEGLNSYKQSIQEIEERFPKILGKAIESGLMPNPETATADEVNKFVTQRISEKRNVDKALGKDGASSKIGKLISDRNKLPEGHPDRALYDAAIKDNSKINVTTNVDTSGNAFSKELGKQFGKDFVDRRKNAMDASNSLRSATNAANLLNEGIITGFGADFIASFGKALQRVGIDYGKDAVNNTQAFYANQASQVAQIIKAFGAGTGLSDADREYAEKAAAGDISMTEGAIRKIIDINARASKHVIEVFNKDVSKIPSESLPFDLKVDVPEFKGARKPDEFGDLSKSEIIELKRLRGLD